MPKQILLVPSVTMSAGKRKRAMIKPLTSPTARPMSIAAAKNRMGLSVTCSSCEQTINIAIDAIAGKETSTPPVMMTNISPMQNIAGTENARSKSTALFPVKNCPLFIWIRRQSSTSTIPT